MAIVAHVSLYDFILEYTGFNLTIGHFVGQLYELLTKIEWNFTGVISTKPICASAFSYSLKKYNIVYTL